MSCVEQISKSQNISGAVFVYPHRLGSMFYNLPRDPITLSEDDWGVQSPPKRKVFRFHYHSQKVIGSLGPIYN